MLDNDNNTTDLKPLIPCSLYYHMCKQYAETMDITIEQANIELSNDIATVQNKGNKRND